jgi:hypothetical protein
MNYNATIVTNSDISISISIIKSYVKEIDLKFTGTCNNSSERCVKFFQNDFIPYVTVAYYNNDEIWLGNTVKNGNQLQVLMHEILHSIGINHVPYYVNNRKNFDLMTKNLNNGSKISYFTAFNLRKKYGLQKKIYSIGLCGCVDNLFLINANDIGIGGSCFKKLIIINGDGSVKGIEVSCVVSYFLQIDSFTFMYFCTNGSFYLLNEITKSNTIIGHLSETIVYGEFHNDTSVFLYSKARTYFYDLNNIYSGLTIDDYVFNKNYILWLINNSRLFLILQDPASILNNFRVHIFYRITNEIVFVSNELTFSSNITSKRDFFENKKFQIYFPITCEIGFNRFSNVTLSFKTKQRITTVSSYKTTTVTNTTTIDRTSITNTTRDRDNNTLVNTTFTTLISSTKNILEETVMLRSSTSSRIIKEHATYFNKVDFTNTTTHFKEIINKVGGILNKKTFYQIPTSYLIGSILIMIILLVFLIALFLSKRS